MRSTTQKRKTRDYIAATLSDSKYRQRVVHPKNKSPKRKNRSQLLKEYYDEVD